MNHNNPKQRETEAPIPSNIYPVIDTDLARDNIENDLPAADLEDLHKVSRPSSDGKGTVR